MERLSADVRELVELLNAHRVEYLIVGGHAVAYHGYPRFTADFDVFVRPSEGNAKNLKVALVAFGLSGFEDADFTNPRTLVMLGRKPWRIDLLCHIDGVSFDEAWPDRVQGTLDGLTLPFIGRDALLRNKAAANRPKDVEDVRVLTKRGPR